MEVALVSSEAYPFAQSGGMGDVVGALFKYLPTFGFTPSLFIPAYSTLLEKSSFVLKEEIGFPFGDRMIKAQFFTREDTKGKVVAVAGENYFNRTKMYGYPDDLERFIFFSRAVFEYLVRSQEQPFVLHAHDWQSALVCAYIKMYWPAYKVKPHKTVFTIHNLAYQGIGSGDLFRLVNLPGRFFTHEYLEFYGNINLLKAGLIFGEVITTVSRSYAREITTAEFGEGLDGLIRAIAQSKGITGIVNGIDLEQFNPADDPYLAVNFTKDDLTGKKVNKEKLIQQYFASAEDTSLPLISFVSRLVEQKGLDLILRQPDKFFNLPVFWLFLGTGDEAYEKLLKNLERRFPRLRAEIKFDETLAHWIYGASDFLLLPSRFEPCGISQLIAMHYGTIPIVRRIGGLADTVVDYPFNPKLSNGFSFDQYKSEELLRVLQRALTTYNQDSKLMERMIANAFDSDFSWERAIGHYVSLYQ